MTWSISWFDHVHDRHPKHLDYDWWDLTQLLTLPRDVVNKDDLPLWSPCRYKPGTTRGAANVLEVTALVLDVDDGTPPREALKPWRDYPHLAHSSWSSTKDKPKYRIVIPLGPDWFVPASQWARVWHWAHQRAPYADIKCKDPSRMYFLPSENGPGGSDCYWSYYWGRVYMLCPRPETMPEPPQKRSPPARRRVVLPPRKVAAVACQRLRTDPEARRRAAEALGAQIVERGSGPWATGVHCPNCNRRSLYWPINPTERSRAWCNHENSCGATFGLWELLPG